MEWIKFILRVSLLALGFYLFRTAIQDPDNIVKALFGAFSLLALCMWSVGVFDNSQK